MFIKQSGSFKQNPHSVEAMLSESKCNEYKLAEI